MRKSITLQCAVTAILSAAATWFAIRLTDAGDRVEAIAVGKGFSVSLVAQSAHPYLAEYEETLEVYGGSAREGTHLGSLTLPMNTGGRIRVLLFRKKGQESKILLRDRYADSFVDLSTVTFSDGRGAKDEDFEFIGAFSGQAYPLKFIPAAIWVTLSDAEKG
jgi:hypothetical protein